MAGPRHEPLLTVEPAIKVASVEQMLGLAIAMEEEAAARYRDLAERMRLQGVTNLEALFRFLAGIEDKHADQIRNRSGAKAAHIDGTARVRWELPEKFEEQEGRSYVLTPYSALAIAVRNEDRAFAFYAYLAAHASSPTIRAAAEVLAQDELDHAALLRRERRKAWRMQPAEPPLEVPNDVTSFFARVAAVEELSAQGHRALSRRLIAQGRVFEAKLFSDVADEEESCARDARTRGVSPASGKAPPAETIRDGLRLLESAFNQYAEIAERAQDEKVMTSAQDFQARALKRLSYIQGAVGNALLGSSIKEE